MDATSFINDHKKGVKTMEKLQHKANFILNEPLDYLTGLVKFELMIL